MPITGRSPAFIAALFLALCGLLLAAPQTPVAALAELASDLSQGDPVAAIAMFDSQTKSYGQIAGDIQALASQTDVSCAIEIVSDTEITGGHKLDLDWILNLKSKDDVGVLERRRERVQVEMKQLRGKWKITAFSPLTVLEPIHVK